jgi:hypothetical protein
VAAPSANYYGGDRKGANLFGNAVVAVDAATGKYKWHFQTIHHDLWDADPPAAPGLIDIVRNGQNIPALAQVTKSGWMFILDRVTGKPVFGMEERPAPKSDVPGEESWPTQPFPLKPPPLARTSIKLEDLVTAADTTPEHTKACQELVEKNGGLNNAGPYTPWPFRPVAELGASKTRDIQARANIKNDKTDRASAAADCPITWFFELPLGNASGQRDRSGNFASRRLTSDHMDFEIVCPNDHDQTVTFSQNEFEAVLKSGALVFHCNTCNTDWPPSSEDIAKLRKQFSKNSS